MITEAERMNVRMKRAIKRNVGQCDGTTRNVDGRERGASVAGDTERWGQTAPGVGGLHDFTFFVTLKLQYRLPRSCSLVTLSRSFR